MAEQQLSSLQLVTFRDVLENVVQEAHSGLQQLADRLSGMVDEERKRQLLQHLQSTRQRLQRLHVCAQWAHKAKAVNTCREVLKASQDHGAAFVHAADELFRLNEELRFSRAPLFDVSIALHIMQTGHYRLLPSIIEDELQQPGQRLERPGEANEAQRGQQRRDALRRIDFLLRSKLLAQAKLPSGMRVLRVRGGQAWVAGAGGQYTAQLTLVPAPRDDVTLAKYRPPEALKEEPEVAQPAAGAAAADRPSTSAAASQQGEASTAGSAAAGQQRQGTEGWRWQLLSFELLPVAVGQDQPALLPQQRQWLQQHVEQRMWAAADVEQLVRQGRAAWVAVPSPPSATKEQGKGAAMPAPSSSQVPSQLPAVASENKGKQPLVKNEPDQQEPDMQQQQEQQEGEGGGPLPLYATSPLAAMHAILCQTAGRLALFSIMLCDARQLEGSSWKGSLKLSRAASGSGIRLSYWQQQPSINYAELQCLREDKPYPPAASGAAAGAASQQQEPPVVEVLVREDGTLAANCSPQLQHPLSGKAMQLLLPLDSTASLSADHLLLQAAASSAAVQLAAVQAVLQRGGRLAPAGIHAELALLPGASPAGAGWPAAALPTSPLLQLWSGSSLQLSLSLQLRSGRLLLAAGPALLESEQSSSAAAAVAVAQQQLDAGQRDALAQPLMAGSSRGMLAARLAAEVLARLSMQLSMRQRMDISAADAATCGLRRATLPQHLLSLHLDHVALLVEPLSSNTLTLALPTFPPPSDMQQWRKQQQQRSAGCGGAAASIDVGATRCFLLLDFGDTGSAAAMPSQHQQATGSNGSAKRLNTLPRVLLAVCSCTSRGTVTRVLQLAELPRELIAEAQRAAAAGPGAPAGSRKRRVDDEAPDLPAAPVGGVSSGKSSSSHVVELGLATLVSWCRGQACWAALRSQMLLLPVQYVEELPLASLCQQQPQQQHVIRLPKAPVLDELEAWAVAHLATTNYTGDQQVAQQLACKPVAAMRLEAADAETAVGLWRVDLASLYFGHLRELLERQCIALAPPAPDATHLELRSGGLSLHYSLQKGHSALTGVTDMVRVGMLHLSLIRLAGCMAVNPLAAAAKAAAAAVPAPPPAPGGGANGALKAVDSMDFQTDVPEPAANGGLLNSQRDEQGSHCSKPADSLVWPLPGCGSVRLLEAGLSHMVLLVAPPPLPEAQAEQQPPPPVRVTVSWGNTLAASAAAGCSSSSGGGSGSSTLKHIRCCIASEPPLPLPVTTALAQQLEAGRSDLFLDALCLAAHSAAAAEAALTPKAQRAASLLPGAVKLLGPGASGGVTSDGTLSSALCLRVQLQHGERAATLCLSFHAAGYTLLQLQPAPTHTACAAAATWLPPLWQRLAELVPSFAAVDGDAPTTVADGNPQVAAAAEVVRRRQARQAWVHRDGIIPALAEVLHTVGAPTAPTK